MTGKPHNLYSKEGRDIGNNSILTMLLEDHTGYTISPRTPRYAAIPNNPANLRAISTSR